MTERSGLVLKTIPCSNLSQRKKHVLKVHAENLKIVQRLKDMKAPQGLLVNSKKVFNNLDYKSRSVSAHRLGSASSESQQPNLISYRYLQQTVTSEARLAKDPPELTGIFKARPSRRVRYDRINELARPVSVIR